MGRKNPRAPWQIIAWNTYQDNHAPGSDAGPLGEFAAAVGVFATVRAGICTRFDFLDLDDRSTFGGNA